MTKNNTAEIDMLKAKIKEGYEESLKCDYRLISDILFDCIGLVAKIEKGAEISLKPQDRTNRHTWGDVDACAAFYLARKYSNLSDFESDLIAKKLLLIRTTLKLSSLKMAIQNFYYLLDKKRGLSSVSRLGYETQKKYEKLSLEEHRDAAEKLLDSAGNGQ